MPGCKEDFDPIESRCLHFGKTAGYKEYNALVNLFIDFILLYGHLYYYFRIVIPSVPYILSIFVPLPPP